MPTSPTDLVLALDIGGTTTTAAVGTLDGRVISSDARPSHAPDGLDSMWRTITELAGAQLAAAPRAPLLIGVSIGGPVSSQTGTVYSPPNLPGWDAFPLADRLSAHLGLPTFVEHDAKAGALAEWLYGAGRGVQTLVFLTLGTGLGAGLIIDGHLCHGRANNLGEVGHWRMADDGPACYGKPGSWEGLSSGAGLAAAARRADPHRWGPRTSAADVLGAARHGDTQAHLLVDRFADALGRGIALLVDLLSPEIVVLGSLAVRAGDLFLPRVQAVVDAECTVRNLPCPVVPAQLGEALGISAAMAVAATHATGTQR